MPEAAVSTDLSISTIQRLINSGKLPARYERGEKGQDKYFIRRADLAGLAELGKGTGPDPRLAQPGSRTNARDAHGVQEHQAGPANGDHGSQEAGAPGALGAPGDQSAPAGAHGVHAAEALGGHGSLGEYAAHWELAVVRELVQGALEAVRLHAERVGAQAKDIGFLQVQLDQSRKAEEQLRMLLARLTAALPSPEEPKALGARNLTPAEKVRWRWPFGRR